MDKNLETTAFSSEACVSSPALRIGRISINPQTRSVRIDDKPIDLTTCEFDLLCYLFRHANQPTTRDQLYRALLHMEYDGLDRRIDNQVSRLRRRIGDDSKNPRLIISIRSTGYQLVQE